MDDKVETPPTDPVENQPPAKTKPKHEQALNPPQAHPAPTPDADLPKVHSEADQ